MLHSSATQWRHRFNLDVALTRGAIILSGFLSGSKSYGAEKIVVIRASESDGGDPFEQTTRYNQDNSWRDEINEYVDCITFDKPVINGASSEAMRTMHLVYSIYCADTKWREKYDLNDRIPEI